MDVVARSFRCKGPSLKHVHSYFYVFLPGEMRNFDLTSMCVFL